MRAIKWLLKHLFILPWSCEGRKRRIARLLEFVGEERDICAALVYYRDFSRGFRPNQEEYEDYERICDRLERGEITMPADRLK